MSASFAVGAVELPELALVGLCPDSNAPRPGASQIVAGLSAPESAHATEGLLPAVKLSQSEHRSVHVLALGFTAHTILDVVVDDEVEFLFCESVVLRECLVNIVK